MSLFGRKAPAKPKPAPLTEAERQFCLSASALMDSHGPFVRDWLGKERDNLLYAYELADDVPTLRLLQGQSMAIRNILNTLNGAGDRLDQAGQRRRDGEG